MPLRSLLPVDGDRITRHAEIIRTAPPQIGTNGQSFGLRQRDMRIVPKLVRTKNARKGFAKGGKPFKGCVVVVRTRPNVHAGRIAKPSPTSSK